MITIRCLGKMGRFGNQLFQYAFARGYADSIGAELRTPSWVGQKLFRDINDPLPIVGNLPIVNEAQYHIYLKGIDNIDLLGYFQHRGFLNYYSLKWCLDTFSFKEEITEAFSRPRDFYIACHVRHGDYAQQFGDTYCIIGKKAYIEAVEKLGYSEKDIVWISEETPHRQSALDNYPEWLCDFLVMMHSDFLLRANSTFGWWAGTLGLNKTYSPVVGDMIGNHDDVEFIEGNHAMTISPKRTEYGMHSKLILRNV